MGYHVEQLHRFKGEGQPEGCYIRGSEVWMGTSGRKHGPGTSSRAVDSSMEQLCSTGKYAKEADDYMEQQEVRARVQQVEQALSESKSKCPPGPCVVLWRLQAQDFV